MSERVAIEWHLGVDPLATEWEALADRAEADPFRRPGWIDAWHEAFGTGELIVLSARRNGRLAAVLALERRGAVLASPTNWHTPVFGPVSESPDAVGEIAAELFARRPRRLSVAFLDIDEPLREETIAQATAASYRTLDDTVQRSPYLHLEGEWEAYWRSLPSKRRNTLKRRRRRLEMHGEVALRVFEGGDELDAMLTEALQVEALGWKGERGSAILSDPKAERFYRGVAGWAAGRGTLRLALLRAGGHLVAFDYALEANGFHYLLKTGFDPQYAPSAPGVVLRTMMIERAYSLGLKSYEFLGGEDDYKLEWTDTVHSRRRLRVFARSPVGIAEWAAFRYGRPAVLDVLGRLGR